MPRKCWFFLGFAENLDLPCRNERSILLQRGIRDSRRLCRQPFLGVSSLNLAAPSGAAFFLSGLFGGEILEAAVATQKRRFDSQ